MDAFLILVALCIVAILIGAYVHFDSKRTLAKRAADRKREDQLREDMMRSWNKNQLELRQTIKPKTVVPNIPVQKHKPAAPVHHDSSHHHHHFHHDTSSPLTDVLGVAVVADLVEDILEDRVEQAVAEAFEHAGGSFGGGGASASWSEPVRESYTPRSRSDYDSGSNYGSGSDSSSSSPSSD